MVNSCNSFFGSLILSLSFGFPFELCLRKMDGKNDHHMNIGQGDHLGLRAAEGNPSIVPAQSGLGDPKVHNCCRGWNWKKGPKGLDFFFSKFRKGIYMCIYIYFLKIPKPPKG